MPAYNESAIIGKVITDYADKICSQFSQVEFIVVNDCSTDNTAEVIRSAAQKYPFVRLLDNETNLGHGPSLVRGLQEARGDIILHSDSDDQFFAEDFDLLFDKLKDSDLVIGWRTARDDGLQRKLISTLGRTLIMLTFAMSVKDSNSPFRLYKRSALDKILPIVKKLSPFFPQILMVVTARKLGMKVEEITVRHKRRMTGKTFIRSFKAIKLCFTAAQELIILKRELKRVNAQSTT